MIRVTLTYERLIPSLFLYKFHLLIASEYFDRIFNRWPDFRKNYSSLGKNWIYLSLPAYYQPD